MIRGCLLGENLTGVFVILSGVLYEREPVHITAVGLALHAQYVEAADGLPKGTHYFYSHKSTVGITRMDHRGDKKVARVYTSGDFHIEGAVYDAYCTGTGGSRG